MHVPFPSCPQLLLLLERECCSAAWPAICTSHKASRIPSTTEGDPTWPSPLPQLCAPRVDKNSTLGHKFSLLGIWNCDPGKATLCLSMTGIETHVAKWHVELFPGQLNYLRPRLQRFILLPTATSSHMSTFLMTGNWRGWGLFVD